MSKSEFFSTDLSRKVDKTDLNLNGLQDLCVNWQFEESPDSWHNYPDDTNILLNIKHFNFLQENKKN